MTFDQEYFNLGALDRLSYQDTVVHRLDPRAKVIATMAFAFFVVSWPKYEVVALAPFFLFPVLLMALGDIPFNTVIKKVLILSPFAVFIGIFNPILDEGALSLFGMTVSAGWLSFLSILLKFTLTISAALLLIATTSFPGVCRAFQKLGMPTLFVSQLLFLYRYLFVMMEETMRMLRARDMRSFGRKGRGVKVAVRIIGTLFLRTLERAERIYGAMLSRGFRGEVPSMKQYSFRFTDAAFLAVAVGMFALFRFVPVPELVGRFLLFIY